MLSHGQEECQLSEPIDILVPYTSPADQPSGRQAQDSCRRGVPGDLGARHSDIIALGLSWPGGTGQWLGGWPPRR